LKTVPRDKKEETKTIVEMGIGIKTKHARSGAPFLFEAELHHSSCPLNAGTRKKAWKRAAGNLYPAVYWNLKTGGHELSDTALASRKCFRFQKQKFLASPNGGRAIWMPTVCE
jgi:hypothetical protein